MFPKFPISNTVWFNTVRRALDYRGRGRACRQLRVAGMAVPIGETGGDERFGAAVARLARLATGGLPVLPGLVVDAQARVIWRRGSLAEQAKALALAKQALGYRAVRFVSADDGRTLEPAFLFEASASPTQPILLQPDSSDLAVHVTRAFEAPGQMAVTANGQRSLIGRLTGRHLGGEQLKFDTSQLLKLAGRAEAGLGTAVEITCTKIRDRWLISACTLLAPATPLEAEADRLVSYARTAPARASPRLVSPRQEGILLQPSFWSERLPKPSQTSLDLVNAMMGPVGCQFTARRSLGLPEGPQTLHMTVLGRMMCVAGPTAVGDVATLARRRRRSLAQATAMSAEMRGRGLAQHRASAVMLSALDLTVLTTTEVLDLWHRQRRAFQTVHADADKLTLLAAFARQEEGSRHLPLDQPQLIRPQWQAEALATRDLPRAARHLALARIAGHRATLDYELAHPRYSEIPGALEVLVETLATKATDPRHPPTAGSAADLLALEQDARHEAVRHLAVLRRLLLDLDRRFRLGGKIFDLEQDEIAALSVATVEALRDLAMHRREIRRALWALPPPPNEMTADRIEQLSYIHQASAITAPLEGRSRGRGTRVSGSANASGRAYIATSALAEVGAPLNAFRDGDVLVTPSVHPAWFDQITRASGIVSERGAPDGAVATAAREHGIAMIVGLPNAGQFRPGDRLTLHADGRVTVDADVVSRFTLVPGTTDTSASAASLE